MTIDRYLGGQLFTGTVLALAALLSLLTLVDFMDEAGDVDEVYTFAHVAHYIWLTTAGRIYELLPVAVLIGGLLNLGNLAAQSELVAMRVAGYSRKRIIFSVLGAGCVFTVLIVLIGETLAPMGESVAAGLRGGDGSSGVFQETGVGVWAREGERFIHARETGGEGSYFGVSLYEFGDGHRLRRVIESTVMEVEAERLVLRDAHEVRIDESRLTMTRLPRVVIERVEGAGSDGFGSVSPAGLDTPALARHVGFLKRSGLRHDFHEYALWMRVSQPLSALVMLLLALPFVFAPAPGSAGQRLFHGILVGLAYMLLSKIFGNAAIVLELSPALGALAVPALGTAVGAYRLSLYR